MKRFILLTMLLSMMLPAVAQRKPQKQEDIYYAAFPTCSEVLMTLWTVPKRHAILSSKILTMIV